MTNEEATITKSPVKEIREKLGLRQVDMAERLGCSLSSERRFEYDGSIPTVAAVLKNFQKLAKQAGVTIE